MAILDVTHGFPTINIRFLFLTSLLGVDFQIDFFYVRPNVHKISESDINSYVQMLTTPSHGVQVRPDLLKALFLC